MTEPFEVNGIIDDERESFALFEATWRTTLLHFIAFCGYPENKIVVTTRCMADGSVGETTIHVLENNKSRYICSHRWWHSHGRVRLLPVWAPEKLNV